MFLQTSEKSLKDARGNYAGIHALPTMEFVVAFAKNMNNVPEKKKLYMEGTNKDPIIGRFDKPSKDDFMTLKVVHNQKTALYGPAFVLCGGKVEGDNTTEQRGPKPKDEVPLCYHSMDIKVYEELTSALNGVAHIDLMCCDGVLAVHSIVKGIPYFGVCYSEQHKDSALMCSHAYDTKAVAL